jgi:pimeloyl-ACP methyl ester carboxylesterase
LRGTHAERQGKFYPDAIAKHIALKGDAIGVDRIRVLGGRSTIVSADTQRELKKTVAGCEIIVMPGLGHYPHLEAADAYGDIVIEFLSRRAGVRGGA